MYIKKQVSLDHGPLIHMFYAHIKTKKKEKKSNENLS